MALLMLAGMGVEARVGAVKKVHLHAPPPAANATLATKPDAKAVQDTSSQVAGQASRTTLTAALKVAVHELFVALRAKPGKDEQESFKDFLPRCLAHAEATVGKVDKSYTDMQLEANLLDQCAMDKEFTVYEDGFRTKKACQVFAKELKDARMEELDSGKTEKYENFCASYYDHVYPEKKKKAPKPEKAAAASRIGGTTALAALVLAAAATNM